MSKSVNQPSPAAERMRRSRERRKRGEVITYVVLGRSAATALVERGLLAPEATTDGNAINHAVGRHLRRTLFERYATE